MVETRWRSARALVVLFPICLVLATQAAAGSLAESEPPLSDSPVIWCEDDRRDIPIPEESDPNLMWTYVDDSVVRPFKRFSHPVRNIRRLGSLFGGDHVLPAADVNRLDEVPNSTWFTNRIGLYPMTPEEVALGPGPGTGPDRSGPLTVICAKTQGVSVGFNARDNRGDTFIIKFDPSGCLGMVTAADIISARLLHAAGYNVPDDVALAFSQPDLVLADDAELRPDTGIRRRMTDADLNSILDGAERLPGGDYLTIASRFLEGIPVGPFSYYGTRKDDPNDLIPHRDRRELRGLKVFAAWLNHFDTKQQNSLDMYVAEGGNHFVRHYLIDFGSTLGAGAMGPMPKHGLEHGLDFPAIGRRAITVGLHEDPWRRLSRPDGLEEIGFFDCEIFSPSRFRPSIPNSAFADLTDRDGYWAAKIISAFHNEHLEAVVAEGRYLEPEAARYMVRMLACRRDKIARYFFDRLPPLDFFVLHEDRLEWHDLGTERGLYPSTETRYRARITVVDAGYSASEWSDWAELSGTWLSLVHGPAAEILAVTDVDRFPFLAVKCQLNRGDGWSKSVTVYCSRASGRVVALDR